MISHKIVKIIMLRIISEVKFILQVSNYRGWRDDIEMSDSDQFSYQMIGGQVTSLHV